MLVPTKHSILPHCWAQLELYYCGRVSDGVEALQGLRKCDVCGTK